MKKLISFVTLLLCINAYALPHSLHEVCFTPPHKQCGQVIVNHIDKANNSIYIQAYGFTHGAIIDSLLQAKSRGVKIEAILDVSNFSESKKEFVGSLQKKGINIYMSRVSGIAHNKVMVIDGEKVITGSFNFTNNADNRNAENVLIATNRALAEKYFVNWNAQKVKR